jgi:hypothetical protein
MYARKQPLLLCGTNLEGGLGLLSLPEVGEQGRLLNCLAVLVNQSGQQLRQGHPIKFFSSHGLNKSAV